MLNIYNGFFNFNELDWNTHSFQNKEEIVSDEKRSGIENPDEETLYSTECFKLLRKHSPGQSEEWIRKRAKKSVVSHHLGKTRRQLFLEGSSEDDEDGLDDWSDREESMDFTFNPLFLSEGEGNYSFDSNDTMDFEKTVGLDWKEEEKGGFEESKGIARAIRFFTDKEPEEWWSLSINEEQQAITINIPGCVGKVKKLIYVFRNKEKNKLLIGKTGQSFSDRLSRYKHAFNSKGGNGDEQEFVADVKNNPSLFQVGILHVLTEAEDLNDFETRFIECKGTICSLYNKRNGGAGGLARWEEQGAGYAIPKNALLLTPIKRYSYQTDEEGHIRLAWTPGLNKIVQELSDSRISLGQGFLYSIKDMRSGKRYIGATMQAIPLNRLRQHGYQAEPFFFANKEKFDWQAKGGALHPAMGKHPLDFTVGFLPIRYNVANMTEEEKAKYHIVSTLGETERKVIEGVGSLVFQNGFNCNKGGGGPIADYRGRK